MIRLGYVGSNTELPSASRTFRLASYSDEKMIEISRSNVKVLEQILHWNLDRDITLFRITSDLIPFGSSLINSGTWKKALKKDFERIGKFIRNSSMRISMHPGQYTVLNTPDELIFANSLRDLEYHASIFELMHLNFDCKIILHGGGAYGDKEKAMKVLKKRIRELPTHIRKRLVMENDERVFTAEDILSVCKCTKLPGVFDIFHHQVLPSLPKLTSREILMLFTETWYGKRQKIHYSEQAPGKNKGAHSETINVTEFGKFYSTIKDLELDIMLEVKDKQVSLLKLKSRFAELR
jgi:UV DNA damage endonuclease